VVCVCGGGRGGGAREVSWEGERREAPTAVGQICAWVSATGASLFFKGPQQRVRGGKVAVQARARRQRRGRDRGRQCCGSQSGGYEKRSIERRGSHHAAYHLACHRACCRACRRACHRPCITLPATFLQRWPCTPRAGGGRGGGLLLRSRLRKCDRATRCPSRIWARDFPGSTEKSGCAALSTGRVGEQQSSWSAKRVGFVEIPPPYSTILA
jgi:hypothetical protein